MKRKVIYFTLVALLLAVTAGVVLYTERSPLPQQHETGETSPIGNITLTIQGEYENKSISILSNTTLLELLQTQNAEDSELQLDTKEYAGLGTLIESMYGYKNGTDGKYWQYKVNDVMPQIGADKYILKPGDAVQWFFGASQE